MKACRVKFGAKNIKTSFGAGVKIIFLGTGRFRDIILERIFRAGHKPVSTQYEDIKKIRPDLVIVANFGKILPKDILAVPRYGCLNIHPSLLPKYRGSTPLQSAILNGDKETGVTIILMDEKIDHGPIISDAKLKIPALPAGRQNSKLTYQHLHDELADLSAELLVKTIPKWMRGEIKLKIQDESKATYTKIFTREDGKINWKKPIDYIERQVRALNPEPGTYTLYKGKALKILETDIQNNKLIIKRVQLAGKKPMSFEDFLRGHQDYVKLF